MPYYVHVIVALVLLYFAFGQLQCWRTYTNRTVHPAIVGTPLMAAISLPKWILEFALVAVLLATRDWFFAPISFALYGLYRAWWALVYVRAQWPFDEFAPGGRSAAIRRTRILGNAVPAALWILGAANSTGVFSGSGDVNSQLRRRAIGR